LATSSRKFRMDKFLASIDQHLLLHLWQKSAAYYIPYVDNLLDTIATPSAMIAGTLVSASTIVSIDPTWQWILALLVGGGSAGIIQAGTGFTRLSSLKFTGGLGNHVVATGENVASIGGSIMAIVTPLLALAGVAILVIIFLWLISKFFIKRLKMSKTAT
jgi:hypothetical protein